MDHRDVREWLDAAWNEAIRESVIDPDPEVDALVNSDVSSIRIAPAVALGACATLTRGTDETVSIITDPPEASCVLKRSGQKAFAPLFVAEAAWKYNHRHDGDAFGSFLRECMA